MNREFAILVPAVVVTSTLAVPTLLAGVVAVMVVELTKAKVAAATPPMVTAVAPVNPVPVMVMVVPPAVEPVIGEILVTVGATAGAPIATAGKPPKGLVHPVAP